MFVVGEVDRLVIGVALINDGDEPLPMDLLATRLIVNGSAVEIFDGGRFPEWKQLEPGRSFGASMGGLGKHFSRPGLYRVQWKGEGFTSAVLEIRVTRN
jgi:hypothetical protein